MGNRKNKCRTFVKPFDYFNYATTTTNTNTNTNANPPSNVKCSGCEGDEGEFDSTAGNESSEQSGTLLLDGTSSGALVGKCVRKNRVNFKKSGRTSLTKCKSLKGASSKNEASAESANAKKRSKIVKRLLKVSVSASIYATIVIFSTVFVPSSHVSARPSAPQFFAPPQPPPLFNPRQSYDHGTAGKFQAVATNCTPPATNNFPPDLFTEEQRTHGAIIIHFIVSLYLFYALYLSCDDYFVPSVESICRELKISSDVAGATFMAAATSFPEFFTNMIGTFVTEGSLGVGTIMGSGVFNILSVAAVCGIGVSWTVEKLKTSDGRVGLPLECWSLTRDCTFYLLSVGTLIIALYDMKIEWFEPLIMIALYGVYIVVLRYNVNCKRMAESVTSKLQSFCCCGSGQKKHHRISVMKSNLTTPMEHTPLLFAENEKGVKGAVKIDGDSIDRSNEDDSSEDLSLSSDDFDELLISKALLRSASYCIDEKNDWGVFSFPRGEGILIWCEWLASWPIRFAFTITIPDCREYSWRKWYPITLVMCVVWIGILSYGVSWMMTIIGDTLGIPESVTGLTFLAAGTSIPEITSSIIVARQGLGSMALSSSVGSNTFDILICLGLPWLIKTALISTSDINYIAMDSGGLEYSAIIMTLTLVILYVMLAWNGFLLDRKIGWVALLLYIIFIVLSILLEMGVFFQVSLPVCSQ